MWSASAIELSPFGQHIQLFDTDLLFIGEKNVAWKAAEVVVGVVVGVDLTGLIYNACVQAEPTAKQAGLCFAYIL